MSEDQRHLSAETVRAARINVVDGESIGVCLYLSAEDLVALGVDPQQSHEIWYRIDPDTASLTISADAPAGNIEPPSTEHSSINR
ncbi:hypothetical protein [Halorubrum vacuolatum]|uniref:hypothetical protein n=1 Tax=Halorubrum vacuolatum TaxID=63740 RepID=UPI00117B1CF7|nr:hypothetical protein [Halorubrum vacuolatum]